MMPKTPDLPSRYGYEYQGTYQRVMCTATTDKARLALFAACHAYNGAIMISKRVIWKYILRLKLWCSREYGLGKFPHCTLSMQ